MSNRKVYIQLRRGRFATFCCSALLGRAQKFYAAHPCHAKNRRSSAAHCVTREHLCHAHFGQHTWSEKHSTLLDKKNANTGQKDESRYASGLCTAQRICRKFDGATGRRVNTHRLVEEMNGVHTSDLTACVLGLPPLARVVYDPEDLALCEANLVRVLRIRSICAPSTAGTVPTCKDGHPHA
jgi:hypothetical protein